jgi:phospholipid/cholesterol/gamma-HCH transport system permease protein
MTADPTHRGILERVGAAAEQRLAEVGTASVMVLGVLRWLLRGGIEPRETVRQMARSGLDSVPIILLTGLFAGMVLALHTASQLLSLGGEGFLGGLVAVSISREAGPVFAAITIAGRVGAGFAAEIGTMKVTEQVDALTVMATDPIRYLVVPRVLALVAMLPVLVLFADVVGMVGGYLVGVLRGVPGTVFLDSVRRFLDPHDVSAGLIKAAVFGLSIALVACFKGLRAGGGADGVGRATTGSVVTAILFVLIANYFLDLAMF